MNDYNSVYDFNKYNKKVGAFLRNFRRETGLTQKEMVADIVSDSFYSKVERGIHGINIDTLFKILDYHDIDVNSFFDNITSVVFQESPHYDLLVRTVVALNHRDKEGLTEINEEVRELKNRGEQLSNVLEIQLASANHFMFAEEPSPLLKEKVKRIISYNKWNSAGIGNLSRTIGWFDNDEAFEYMKQVMDSYIINEIPTESEENAVIVLIANYLFWSYKKHADKEQMHYVIDKFLNRKFKFINVANLFAKFYQALIDGDKELQDKYIWALKECGQYAIIKDIVEEQDKNE